MVAIFPNVCLWCRSYAQNWEVLTLKNCHLHMPVRPTLLHHMALVSFLLFRKNLGNLQEFFGQIVYRPPLAKNCPYAYGHDACMFVKHHSLTTSDQLEAHLSPLMPYLIGQ